MAEVTPGADTAPVETPVAAPEATQQPEGTAPQVETKPEAEKTLTQSEVNKIVARVRAQESRRAERLARAELERDQYKAQIERSQQPQAQGKPDPKNFQTYEDYVDAIADWKAEQKLQGFKQEFQKSSQAEQQTREAQEQARAFNTKLQEGAKKYQDFEAVALADDVPNTKTMVAAMSKLGNVADVAYYLGSNLDEAAQIAGLSEIEQIWAIRDLGKKLEGEPKPTKVPPPIVPNNATASTKVDTFQLPWDEFVKKRREERRRR